jgi:hypothetical protein
VATPKRHPSRALATDHSLRDGTRSTADHRRQVAVNLVVAAIADAAAAEARRGPDVGTPARGASMPGRALPRCTGA